MYTTYTALGPYKQVAMEEMQRIQSREKDTEKERERETLHDRICREKNKTRVEK